jgi:hypothetical protein
MARILIAGCGDIGTTLGLSLHAAGHRVWGLKRRPTICRRRSEPLAADLADPATLTGCRRPWITSSTAPPPPASAKPCIEAAYVSRGPQSIERLARRPVSSPNACC